MCLLVLAWRAHPGYRLIFAGNRDEFHARPTAPAHWWEDRPGLLAGRDRQAGGTWLGCTSDGRFAVVTNFRELGEKSIEAPSRGSLILDFAREQEAPGRFLARLERRGSRYAGFNLIFGDRSGLHYYSNRGARRSPLAPGVHGLSNHFLDTPWPKLERTRQRFESLLGRGRVAADDLLELLADREPATDAELPETGLPRDLERALSAPFIVSPRYGTRCSTALLLGEDGSACFAERRFDAEGVNIGEDRFNFCLTSSIAPA